MSFLLGRKTIYQIVSLSGYIFALHPIQRNGLNPFRVRVTLVHIPPVSPEVTRIKPFQGLGVVGHHLPCCSGPASFTVLQWSPSFTVLQWSVFIYCVAVVSHYLLCCSGPSSFTVLQ